MSILTWFINFLTNFMKLDWMASENSQPTKSTLLTQRLRWLLAGAAAGLAVDLSLYPLDTIKTRMQSKAGFSVSGGFRQIYRGIPAVALGSAPGSALFFVTYSSTKEFAKCRWHAETTPLLDAISATFGEISACIARLPTEIVKQRAQTTHNRGFAQIAGEIYATSGLRGFYRGYVSTVCREIPFSFIEFPLWELLKRRWRLSFGKECSPLESAACGSLAGLTAAAITTPLDVLKTRVMLDRSRESKRLLPLALAIVRQEGLFRLYAGVVPRSLWMGLGGFIFFFSYEFALQTTQILF